MYSSGDIFSGKYPPIHFLYGSVMGEDMEFGLPASNMAKYVISSQRSRLRLLIKILHRHEAACIKSRSMHEHLQLHILSCKNREIQYANALKSPTHDIHRS